MRSRPIPILAFVLTVGAVGPSVLDGQQSAADLTPVASVEGITEYRLDNGLRVLLFPDPSKPQITVNITYSRLSNRIRDQEGLSYAVQAVLSGHPIDPAGQFLAVAIFAPENVDRVEAALIEELEKVLAEGFTEAELAGARQGWLEGRQLSRAQDGNLAGAIGQNLYFDRTFQFDAALEDRVRSVTLEEVNQAIRDRLDLSKLTIVKAGDFANKRTTIG